MMLLEKTFVMEGSSAKGAVVVAHPDDEALWFAGLMLQWPIQWTVIACSIPAKDPERAWKFYKACDILGAQGKVVPVTESPVGQPLDAGVMRMLDEELDQFDIIATHSVAGEYGHNQHIDLHGYCNWAHPDKTISGMYGVPVETIAARKGFQRWTCALSDEQFDRKLDAIRAYDHPHHSGRACWEFLLMQFEKKFDLRNEIYEGPAIDAQSLSR